MAAENRYSQTIAWVRVILPLLALVLLSTLFLFSNSPDPDLAIPFADFDVEQLAREQRLGQPRFAGTLEDGREILFIAETAAPVAGAPDQIDAQVVQARVATSETGYILLTSGRSRVDMASRTAEMETNVHITSSTGYRLQSDLLHMSLDVLNMVSPGPVRVTGPSLTLTADDMNLSEENGAQVLSFNGQVRVLYDPED
ncbi:hypothetical protein E2K80_15910 [Rhodophyticola sp. CCM32]|uniref:hypothetical protein n=1 Tax=Rhodophyticola sp. CCM32 TaxID=2916397 RepID=UPI00107F61DD|nr:hypothetical protein [Rhodophyticola sp. CCM32]QBY02031.1 hypothetical protein E2K80_15910 [Rhodophyticola sp. CCM32]